MSVLLFCLGFGSLFSALVVATLLGALEGVGVIESVAAAVGVLFLLLGVAVRIREGDAKKVALEFISSQSRLFSRKRSQLVFKDDYGIEKVDAWEKEKQHIFRVVVPTYLRKAGYSQSIIESLNYSPQSARRYLMAIEDAAKENAADGPVSLSDVTTGIDYERFCAERLRAAGWDAKLTKATGDQGTDIIAEHSRQRGQRVVIQCKFYTSPVGNKAVQEVVAARLHEGADRAIVVTNATYTKSARQLAGTMGVILLHHDELPTLLDRLKAR
jgi:restriction system protein